MKYSNVTLGTIEAVWNKLGGEEGVAKFLRGETTVTEPTRSWREEDGIIYFSVESDGTTGEEWITRLEKKGFRVGDYAKQVLRSSDFKPTKGVRTEIVVLKGMLFEDCDRITENIRAEAEKCKLSKPNAELACLVREKFADEQLEQMGVWYVVAMHEPIKGYDGVQRLLNANRFDDGSLIDAYLGMPVSEWNPSVGFAFAVSQVSSLD